MPHFESELAISEAYRFTRTASTHEVNGENCHLPVLLRWRVEARTWRPCGYGIHAHTVDCQQWRISRPSRAATIAKLY